MKKVRFLVRLIPREPDRGRFLESIKSIGRALGSSVKHPRWTSYGAVEVDVFAPAIQDFELFVAAVEPLARAEFTKNLDEPPQFKPKEELLQEAREYFDAERYWECHETLEGVWRPSKGKEKLLLQAIILVCAAQVHEQRGERDVALSIYRRALPQISWDGRSYFGVDVPRLRSHVEAALEKGVVSPFKM